MTKTTAALGIVYALFGALALAGTSLIGPNGFFAADSAYGVAFALIGTVLVLSVLALSERGVRVTSLVVGTVLTIAALAGFLIVPGKGDMFGMFVNTSDHAMNLVFGLTLAGSALLSRAARIVEQPRATVHQRYSRYARHA